MSDLDFAALMATIIRIESGAIHHRPADYSTVAFVKSIEIWYNRGMYPKLLEDTTFGERLHLGYQTEGIANISIETINNLRLGLVPDAAGNLQPTGIEIYNYSGQLPGLFPFPGLTTNQQINLFALLHELLTLTKQGNSLYIPLYFPCIDTFTLLQSVRQDQNIEYLAANLEAGAIRARWEGTQPTPEVLSWWHHRGIVTMIDEKEIQDQIDVSQDRNFIDWAEGVLVHQAEARNYWKDLVSVIMEEAIGLLNR